MATFRKAEKIEKPAEDKRIDMDGILRALEYPINDQYPIVKETRKLFIPGLQGIAEVYVKLSTGRTTGADGFAKRFLLGKCTNDLTVGFHLGRQGYFPQSYSMLRSILESLDLIALLNKRPEFASTWTKGGIEAWKELKPTEVRKKLGLPKDGGYSLLSELGPHATFGSRHGMSAARKDGVVPQIRIWIGGTKFIDGFVFVFGLCFILQMKILSTAQQTFPKEMPKEMFLETAKTIAGNFARFTSTYGRKFAEESGLDFEPLIKEQEFLKEVLNDPQKHAKSIREFFGSDPTKIDP